MSGNLQRYQMQTVPVATPAQVGTGKQNVKAVLLIGGSAASSVELKNAATDTGDVLLTLKCVANDSRLFCFEELGGIAFSTAVFCKPAGTGAAVQVWYE